MKKIAQVTVRVKDARGIQVGLNQGALAVQLWTGVDPDRDVMRARLAAIFAAG